MAKVNYAFEKRQRELAKKKQKEEKRAKKRPGNDDAPAEAAGHPSSTGDAGA